MKNPAGARAPLRGKAADRPNILLIQLDDQVLSDLSARYLASTGAGHGGSGARGSPRRSWKPVLPNIRRLLIDRGVSFGRYYVSVPLCCPSRAALLTGRYAKNNGVLNNAGRHGGFAAFRRHDYRANVAVWLQHAGYWTIHVGKFLNGYGPRRATVPPGWRDWQTLATDPSTSLFYGYRINANGVVSHPYGDPTYRHKDPPSCSGRPSKSCKYLTDVLTQKAVTALAGAPQRRPFYLQLDYTAPHVDRHSLSGPEPPPRYSGGLPGARAPRTPAFNERQTSDKPAFLRKAPLLTRQQIANIDRIHKLRLESERAVDDGVGRLMRQLARLGRLSNTYVFLISDNGWFQGEHRFASGKFLPYEPSTHMPLLIRGPGIPAGATSEQLAANIDLAPTFLQIAHARPGRPVDGRGLLGFAEHPRRNTRRAVLLEGFTRGKPLLAPRDPGAAPPAAFEGIRVGPYKYVKYGAGPSELYNLARDPFELQSLARDPRYRRVERWLSAQLRRLEGCKGASCRAKVGPIPRPTGAA